MSNQPLAFISKVKVSGSDMIGIKHGPAFIGYKMGVHGAS